MAIFEITDILLEAKKEMQLTFAQLGELLERDKVWVAALFYGQARASEEEASKLLEALDLDEALAEVLTDFPLKGVFEETVPRDPLIYRFYEIMQVYGMPMKDVIQEEFGDGIMSAIDFTLTINKQEDPKGDRVVVTYNGKFLPYKKW
jgi:cyanate lyase